MPKVLDLQLKNLLKERGFAMTNKSIADELGISDGLLRTYLENRWTVLDRTVLERLADFFECDAGALLATRETQFFDPFRVLSGHEPSLGSPYCLFLRREDADKMAAGRALAYRDHRAMNLVETLLRDKGVERLTVGEVSASTEREFGEQLLLFRSAETRLLRA